MPRGRFRAAAATTWWRDIESHLAESAPAGAPEAEVRTALDRLGDPDQIVAAERDDDEPEQRRGRLEWTAIILLLVGGVVIPFVGWIVGAVLLWVSQAWTLRDKLIGTLVLPGGLLAAIIVVAKLAVGSVQVCRSPGVNGAAQTCAGGVSEAHRLLLLAVFVAAVVLPFVTAVYLARRAYPDG